MPPHTDPPPTIRDVIRKKLLMLLTPEELNNLKTLAMPKLSPSEREDVKIQEITDGILFFTGNELGQRTYVATMGYVGNSLFIYNVNRSIDKPIYPDSQFITVCNMGITSQSPPRPI